MIKIIEKDFLDDDFIIKPFANNICINENIYFNKKDTYYFGNYKEDKINLIKDKINKNKRRIIKAIENNITFIIHGNSIDIFNNSFKANDINLFTAYSKKEKTKKDYIKKVDNLNLGIDTLNFKYKNLTCFK